MNEVELLLSCEKMAASPSEIAAQLVKATPTYNEWDEFMQNLKILCDSTMGEKEWVDRCKKQ